VELYVKQKLFTLGDRFSVYDQDGKERYWVKGKLISFGKHWRLYDAEDRELAWIEQKLWDFMPTYRVFVNGDPVATVRKKFTLFKHEYLIEGPDWEVYGDFFGVDYSICEQGHDIATVRRELFSFGDAYRISISPNADTVTALAVVLVIDACIDAAQRN